MKKGSLSVIIGTLAVIAAAFAAMFVTAFVAGLIINAMIKDSPSFVILSIPTVAVFSVYFVLFEILFFKWQFKLSLEARSSKTRLMSSMDEEPISPEKFKKISSALTVIVVCLCLVFPAIYMSSYTEFDGETVTQKTLFIKKDYTTANVNGYSLLCDDDGMRFTISMRDGKSYELFNADSLISPAFNEKYESMFGYAAYLSDVYDSQERIIRKRVSGADRMKEVYEENHPDVYKYLEQIIAEDN